MTFRETPEAARELDLYAENTSSLYGQFQSIIKNIKRRVANGTYDPTLAPKLWAYWYDAAAVSFAREHGQGAREARVLFPTAVRHFLADQRAAQEFEKIQNGEYASV